MSNLNKKILSATKWSSFAEIAAKLVAPISTMVLARVLTPEAFGVLVTATMVISFAEIFTDAGFQKYIVQHEFDDDDALFKATNVAFWSNLILSIILWVGIIIFAEPIAQLVGNKGHGNVIAISCICVPLAAFSSIQMALYRRHFDYKTLFIVRMFGISIPLFITIPLAFLLRSYWSLIFGMIGLNMSNAIILTIKSKWKPTFEYDLKLLKEMFSFTVWSMLESVSIWMTGYIDIFIVGKMLNEYYLGIYRTSMSTVGQFTSIITVATSTVLFSSLSRLQNEPQEFQSIFFKFQKLVGLLVIPLGFLIYIFRDLIVSILLGTQWEEASYFMGIWALTSSITIVLAHYCSEVYRALGKPKISVFVQLSHVVFLIPTVWFSINYGFNVLCSARALVRLELVLANLIIIYYIARISPWKMVKNITPELFCALIMTFSILILPIPLNLIWEFIYLIIACAVYIGCSLFFPKERYIIFNLRKLLNR